MPGKVPPKSLKALIPGYGVGGDDEGAGMGETKKPAAEARGDDNDAKAEEVVSYLDEANNPQLSAQERYEAFMSAITACK